MRLRIVIVVDVTIGEACSFIGECCETTYLWKQLSYLKRAKNIGVTIDERWQVENWPDLT